MTLSARATALTFLQQLNQAAPPALDFHLHTNWTDGKDSVEVMHHAATEMGLEALLFTEHTRAQSAAWYPDFARAIRTLPSHQCQAFVGTEVRIANYDGQLDTHDSITQRADLIVASVHRFPEDSGRSFSNLSPDQALSKEFSLSMAALENPLVDILGHPFGMSLKRYKTTPPLLMLKELMTTAKKFGVAFELNTKYHEHLTDWLKLCRELDVKISFGSDAHASDELANSHCYIKDTE